MSPGSARSGDRYLKLGTVVGVGFLMCGSWFLISDGVVVLVLFLLRYLIWCWWSGLCLDVMCRVGEQGERDLY